MSETTDLVMPEELQLGSRTQTSEQIAQVYESLGYETPVITTTDDALPVPVVETALAPEPVVPDPDAGDPAGEADVIDDPVDGETAEQTEQRKKRSGSARQRQRNQELRAEVEELRKRNEEHEKRLAAFETSRAKVVPIADAPAATAEPTLEDVDENGEPKYANYEQLTRAIVRWELKEERRIEIEAAKARQTTEAEDQRKAADASELTARQERWQAQIDVGKTHHTDFEAVLKQADDMKAAVPLTEALKDSDLQGELVYHLATHPEELDRLNGLLDIPANASNETFRRKMRVAYREIEALEAKVSQNLGDAGVMAGETEESDPEPDPAPVKAAVVPIAAQAAVPLKPKPEPIRPVGNRGATTRKTLATMSRDEIHALQAQDPDAFRRLVEAAS